MISFVSRVAAIAVLFNLTTLAANAQRSKNYPPVMDEATVETYKQVDGTELKLWIFHPPQSSQRDKNLQLAPRPAIIFFFGGGWRSGTPEQFHHHCRYLAKQGMVAITADYRVLQRNETLADKAVADAKSAIRYVRQHAKRLGVHPNQIVASGGSAGGHLAACTDLVSQLDEPHEDQTISSRPNALAMFNPALVLAPWEGVHFHEDEIKELVSGTGVAPSLISPILQIKEGAAPSIIFHGKADTAVPYVTAERFAQETQRRGNRCELIGYEGESHGFFNYGREGTPGQAYLKTLSRLHEFLNDIGFLKAGPSGVTPASQNVRLREPLIHSWKAITEDKRATVAFIGGSITEMNGYRPMVCNWMEQTFPNTNFKFVNAGISSTCSTTGAFRFDRDVLSHSPDLILIEFAVNDDQDAAHTHEACVRGMEGIIRHARTTHPQADLVVTYFVNPSMLETWQKGEVPLSVAAHETVMKRYGVSSVVLAKEVAERITQKTFTWKEYGGTHPAPAGNQIAANLVQDLLTTAWSLRDILSLNEKQVTQRPLPKPIDKRCYQAGTLMHVSAAVADNDWTIGKPNWKTIPGAMRSRFENLDLLHSSKTGAEFQLDFHGTAIGLFILAGPDAAQVQFEIDGHPARIKDLYHRHSRGLHYPRTVMLDDQLDDGPHRLKLSIHEANGRENAGSSVRILAFTTNTLQR